jgi:transposase
MARQIEQLTKHVLDAVRGEPICRRLMTVPGVEPLTALAFRATVDQPERFRRSRDVGAHLGLTPRRYQSGETDTQGRISRCGDELARTALYEAAHTLLTRCQKWSTLKRWGMGIAQRRGMAKARVAVARKLAVILHRMWSDQAEFRWGKAPTLADNNQFSPEEAGSGRSHGNDGRVDLVEGPDPRLAEDRETA